MNVDVLFTSKSGTLYAGIERGGKFTGKPVRDDGVMHRPMKPNMDGTLVARFVNRVELGDDTKALPLYADVMVEGAVSPVGLGQYLRDVAERRARAGSAATEDAAEDAAE